MREAVLDASAILDSLLESYPELDDTMGSFELHASELISVEVLSTLRRLASAGRIEASRGAELLNLYSLASITRHSPHDHLHRMWELRHTISAYDASYVALAEALGCPLITRDRRLAAAAAPYVQVIVPA